MLGFIRKIYRQISLPHLILAFFLLSSSIACNGSGEETEIIDDSTGDIAGDDSSNGNNDDSGNNNNSGDDIIPDSTEFTITAATGFINGWVVDASNDQPLGGVAVTVEGIEGVAYSNNEGIFNFPVDPENQLQEFQITLQKQNYTKAYRSLLVRTQRDSTVEEVRLTPLDDAVTVIGSQGGTHVNSTGNIEITVPAGALSEEASISVTEFHRGEDLGGVLPEISFFTYAMDFQPDGLTFDKPITVRMENTRGFAPGSEIPVGHFSETTRVWEHIGMAVVDESGDYLIAENMIDHFSSVDINYPIDLPPGAFGDEVIDNRTADMDGCGKGSYSASKVCLAKGDLTIYRDLPGYQIFGSNLGLQFIYQSNQVAPKVLVSFAKGLDTRTTTVPEQIGFKAIFGHQVQEKIFQGSEETGLFKALFDGQNSQFLPCQQKY